MADCGCAEPADVADPPIACSLSGDAMQGRIDEWRAVLTSVVARERVEDGVRLLVASPEVLPELSRLAAAEHECCPFFSFRITIDGRGAALEATAPADGQELLEAVFGSV